MHVLAERRAGRWSDLGTRVLSALVLAPVALVCVWMGGIAFGVIAAAVGIRLWHGLGSSFGLGAAQGVVDRKAVAAAVGAFISWIILYLIV